MPPRPDTTELPPASPSRRGAWAARGRYAGAFALVATVYGVLALLGLRWAIANGVASPVWPAAGFGLAALVLGGTRLAPAIVVGYLVATAFNASPHPAWTIVVLAVGNAVAAWLGAWSLRRGGFRPGMETFRDVLMFVAAAIGTAGVAASIAGLTLAPVMALDAMGAVWLWTHWFFGDLSGVLVICSLLLAWSHAGTSRSPGWWVHFGACVALTIVLGALVFLPAQESRMFTFIAFCPLIWAALAVRLQGAMVVVLVLATIGVIGTTAGMGPFAYTPGHQRFIDLQVFIAVVSTATLVLAVVADERRAQQALMNSEAQLRFALEASRTGLWKLELPDGSMTLSPECHQVTGLAATDFESSRAGIMPLVHPDDREGVRAAFIEAVQGGGLFESSFRLVRPDGHEVWLEARARAVFDDNGRAVNMQGTVSDITERKHAERRLAEQARLLDLAGDAIIIRDLDGRIRYWNEGAVEMFGHTREQAHGQHVGEMLRTEYPEPYARIHDALLRADRWTGELVNVTRDGERRVVQARWVLNRDARGQPVSVLQTHTDITERKHVESTTRFLVDLDRAIAQSQSADEIVSAALPLVGAHLGLLRCTLTDIDLERGRVSTLHEWTNGAPRVSGVYDASDFFRSDLGLRLASGEAVAVHDLRSDPLTADQADNYLPYGTAALAAASYVSGGRLAGTLTIASGTPRHWHTHETQLLREIVARVWPAIERAKAVAALRESEARFRQMADTAPMMIWVTDPDGGWSYVSRRWSEFTGRLPEIELGTGWLDVVHPDDRAAVEHVFATATREQDPFKCEFRTLRWDGAYRWMLATGRPRLDAGNAFMGFIGAAIDITERRDAEEALREADRRKDEFLATLAHELRNPLSPIRTGLQVLNLTRDADSARRTRQMMERQLGHMVRLIDDLLDVSRITSGKVVLQRERIPLQDAARAALEAVRPQLEAARHRLEFDAPPEPVWVDADPTRLTQVVGNLLTNAAKYTPDGGRLRLQVSALGDDGCLAVTDSGLGIPPESLDEVFDMFAQVNRTLDRAQGGLGIGLALARRLMQMHGGTVVADSEGLGRGSTFTVRLPLAPEAPDACDGADATSAAVPGLRVLVVDDNVDAADTLAMMLQLEGHEVRSASGGAEGLELAMQFGPAVAFLDIGMPGMNGHELARRLRADARTASVFLVAVSGWGAESDKQLAAEAGFDRHLTKPVSIAALQQALADASEAGRQAVGPAAQRTHPDETRTPV